MYTILTSTSLLLGLALAQGGPVSPYPTQPTCTVTATADSGCSQYCNVGPTPTTIIQTKTQYEACSNCALVTQTLEPPCPAPPPQSFTITCPTAVTSTSTVFACATCTKTATVGFTCPPACNVGKPQTTYYDTVSATQCGDCALVTQTAYHPCPAVPPASVTPITCPAGVTSTTTLVTCAPTPTPY